MLLARLVRLHPGELRADFQQFYGLNLDGMGSTYSVHHAAELAGQLPQDSRCYTAEHPINEWTLDKQLLALIEYRLHWLCWAKTEDGRKMRNYPKCLIPSEEQERCATSCDAVQMPVDEMMHFVDDLIGGTDGE